MKVWVLRLNHRLHRDERISSHVGLVVRAFGCNGIIFSGEQDKKLMNSIKKVVRNWGGLFEVKYEKSWKKVVKSWGGKIVHLTMYGISIQRKIKEIKNCKNDLLIIVGSAKVSGEAYQLSDWNIAITNQPHSEVAALSVFLHELFEGKELKGKFKNAKIKVLPQRVGKKTVKF